MVFEIRCRALAVAAFAALLAGGCTTVSREPDPHAWLNDFDSAEALDWARRVDSESRDRLERHPRRPAVRASLERLAAAPQSTVPLPVGDALLYLRIRPDAGAPVLMIRRGESEEVLADPSERWPGMRIVDFRPSRSGRLLLVAAADPSTELLNVHLFDIATKRELASPNVVRRLSQRPWSPDDDGYYFTRRLDASGLGVFFRAIESGEETRVEIPEWRTDAVYSAAVLGDGSLLVTERAGGVTTRHLRRRHDRWDSLEAANGSRFIGDVQGRPWFLRGDGAIVEIGDAEESRVVLESGDPIREAWIFGDRVLALVIRDARPQLLLHRTTGEIIAEVRTPLGLIWTDHLLNWSGVTGDGRFAYVRTLALAEPGAILRVDLRTGESETFWAPSLTRGDIRSELVHYPSEGARVPMFIARKPGAGPGPLRETRAAVRSRPGARVAAR